MRIYIDREARSVLLALLIVAIILSVGAPRAGAQNQAGRSIDTIVDEILENQDARRVGNVNPNEVEPALLEELGEAVMEEMAGGEEHRLWMEEMMGGEGSRDLAEAHRWMGYRYILSGGNLGQMGWSPGMMGPGMMGYGMMGYGRSGDWLGDSPAGRDRGPWGPAQRPGWRHNMMRNRGDWDWSAYPTPAHRVPGWVWAIVAVLLLVLLVLGVMLFQKGRGPGAGGPRALDILRERYAKGEITREEFQEMKDNLS